MRHNKLSYHCSEFRAEVNYFLVDSSVGVKSIQHGSDPLPRNYSRNFKPGPSIALLSG